MLMSRHLARPGVDVGVDVAISPLQCVDVRIRREVSGD